MDEVEHSDLEKERNDSHTPSIKMRYIIEKEKMLFSLKKYNCGVFSFVFVIKPGGRIFSVGLKKTNKDLKP